MDEKLTLNKLRSHCERDGMVALIEAEANNLLEKIHYHIEQMFNFETLKIQMKNVYLVLISKGFFIDQSMMVEKFNEGIDINGNVAFTVARSPMLDNYHDDFAGAVHLYGFQDT